MAQFSRTIEPETEPLQEVELNEKSDEQEEAAANRKARRAAQSKRKSKARRVAKSKRKSENQDNSEDADVDNDDDPRPTPEEVLHLIMTEITVAPEIAGAAHGIGRNSAYLAIHNGQIVANRVGNKLTCPTAPLRRQLGIDPPLQGAPTPQIAVHSKKQETVKSPAPRRRS